MLNDGNDMQPSAADETSVQEGTSHTWQIVVIVLVGLYLFGVVYMYAHLPWLAIGVTGIAVAMIIVGFVQQLRNRVPPPGD